MFGLPERIVAPAQPTSGRHHTHVNDTEEQEWAEHEIHHYRMSHWFELAVEVINSCAGMLVILSVLLAGVNIMIVAINAMTDREYKMINPLHHGHNRIATVVAIRLMLGELTALALALLVAADVVDTVIKPSHAYEMSVVIKMGFITVLRTGLAYFLAHEIAEQENVLIVRSKSTLGLDMGGGFHKSASGRSPRISPPGSSEFGMDLTGLSSLNSHSNKQNGTIGGGDINGSDSSTNLAQKKNE